MADYYNVGGYTVDSSGTKVNGTLPTGSNYYNAPPPTSPTSSTPGVFSSVQGQNLVQQSQTKEASMTPPPPTTTTTPTDTTTPTTPTSSVTLINPNTDQKVTFENPDINKDNINGYLAAGYTLSEANGSIPSWLSPQKDGSFSASPESADLTKAKADYDTAISNLKSLNVENDPALQGILSGITSAWDRRIAEMQNVNKSREAATNTQNIRLGSRYTGAIGAGILSEEERQGAARIADIESQKQQVLAQARQAFQAQKWEQYAKFVDIAQHNYDQQLSAVAELNKAQAAQTAKLQDQARIANIGDAVSAAIGLGVSDTKNIFDALSKSSTLQGLNATPKEVQDALSQLAGTDDTSKLSSDLRDFNYLKTNNMLPDSVTGLPGNQQFLAWQQAQKEASQSDNYAVVTDPVTGNQSVFNKKTGKFESGGFTGTGANGTVTQNDFILNAAKQLAVKDPSGGKLLVRTVSQKLAAGDSQGALQFIKDAAINTLPATVQSDYATFENAISSTGQALQLANSSSISAGFYKDLYESKKPLALIDKDPKYAQLKQLVGLADAQIRRGFFGTAVTASEGGTASAFLFNPDDNMALVKQKLRGNLAFFSFVNDATISRATGLPRPNLQEYMTKFGVDTGQMQDPVQNFLNGQGTTTSSSTNPAGI